MQIDVFVHHSKMKLFLFLSFLPFSLLALNQASIDTIVPTKKIDRALIVQFVDSLKQKILSDTILFDTTHLEHFNYLSNNSKPYSALYIINFRCQYKLDIINSSMVLEFVNEFLDPTKIESIELLSPQVGGALFYKYGDLGVVMIFMKKRYKVNYKVAGLKKLYRKNHSTNFDQNPPGKGRWFY